MIELKKIYKEYEMGSETIGALDRPNGGKILIDGINLDGRSDGELSRYRNQSIGFVFQSFYPNQLLKSIRKKTGITLIISPPSWLVFGVIAFTTLIGAMAGVYPAFRAANLDPVEALKYE